MRLRSAIQSSFFLKSLFAFSIALLFFIAGMTYRQILSLENSEGWVVHTYQVALQLHQLPAFLETAESAQRGYLLTADTAFLSEFHDAKQAEEEILVSLKTIMTDNITQVLKLDTLRVLTEQRLAFMELTLSRFSPGIDLFPERRLISGTAVMDLIRLKIDQMIDVERTLLAEREKTHEGVLFVTPFIALLLVLFSLFVFLLLFRRIMKELREKNAMTLNLETQNKQLDLINSDLERTNTELASFNYIASHDLQEPLRKVQTFISRFIEKENANISESGKEFLAKIQSSAKRMQNLIDDLLVFSHANTAQKIFEHTDLNTLLEKVKEECRDQIEEKKALVKSVSLPTLRVVGYQFEQLFSNLLTNSLKYSKPHVFPIIMITSDVVTEKESSDTKNTESKQYYKISFTDNGIGFEQQYAERIFKLFQRLHGKTEYSGTGVGLAICKKIVENHNGFITAQSKPDEGSTFSIFVPVDK